jgi:hypothetical protein
MGLVKGKEWTGTTSGGAQKPMMCHTCHLRKTGLFTLDLNRRPQCSDCSAAQGRPIL